LLTQVICPSGAGCDFAFGLFVQPLSKKYFCFSEMQIRDIFRPSRPTEGRLAIVTNAGRDAVDARRRF
jgi:hypothetical protein